MSLARLCADQRTVGLGELFRGFCLIGLSGFGGVMPWARHYIVDRYHWLEAEEFAALLGFGQVMPGPNVMNLSVCVGQKFQGWRGALVAPLGIIVAVGGLRLSLLPVVVIVLALGLALDLMRERLEGRH